jgi:GT2 family glycosyltransferase
LAHELIAGGWRDLSARLVSRLDLARDVLIGDELSAEQSREVIAKCPRQTRISLIVPIRPGACRWLEDSIRSVCRQHYRDWELILAGDASADAEAGGAMQRWPLLDARIMSCRASAGSTPEAVNLGLQAASGDFVGFLEPGDELAVDALTWFVHAMNARPSALWLYSDEDAIDEFQLHHSPHFKPDFSPEYLLSSMFSSGTGVYAIDRVRSIGGCRPEEAIAAADAWHHDLALRLSEVIDRRHIVHVPRLLYHRRAPIRSAGLETAASTAGRRVVAEALHRRDIPGSVIPCPKNAAIFQIDLEPRDTPRVAVVIPTRNALDLLRPCVASLRGKTSYPNYSLVIIDNQSDDPALHEYLRTERRHGTFDVFEYPRPFNHSQMHNELISQLAADFVVLVNNDVQVLSDRWLEQMIATVQLSPDVAGVGALLRYPDGSVQHGGVILGLFGVAGHAHRFLAPSETGYFGRCACLQEVSAATGACLLLRRDAFLEVGGFRADRYPNSFNDVDLWLRLRQRGYRCLYNPQVMATHYETATRTVDVAAERESHRRLLADWGPALLHDPFYNPNLSLNNESFHGFRRFSSEALMRRLSTPEPGAADIAGTGRRLVPPSHLQDSRLLLLAEP